jgi:hypothetical protein
MLSTKTGVPDAPEAIDLDFVLSGATAKQARSPKRPIENWNCSSQKLRQETRCKKLNAEPRVR